MLLILKLCFSCLMVFDLKWITPDDDQAMVIEMRLDKLTPEKLKELQALVGMLEKLKS